jgi:hypothetical protein
MPAAPVGRVPATTPTLPVAHPGHHVVWPPLLLLPLRHVRSAMQPGVHEHAGAGTWRQGVPGQPAGLRHGLVAAALGQRTAAGGDG